MSRDSSTKPLDEAIDQIALTGVFAAPDSATLSDEIYVALREGLMVGEWLPGSKITARSVAKKYNTSLSPARDAMTRLANEGGLTLSEKRMYSVPRLSPKGYMEVIELRLALEPIAALQAVANISEAAISQLDRLNEDMRELIDDGEFQRALILDSRFHLDFYRACDSLVLRQVISNLWLRIGPTRNMLFESYRREMTGYKNHRLILGALKRKDGARIVKLIKSDLQQGAERIEKALLSADQ
jgi:DNA-binding GntR family transcriptional regulator